jgi:anti-sigma factor RsiW
VTHTDREVEARLREPGVAGRPTAAVSVIEVDHAEVRDNLSEYLDGSMSIADADRVRQHLDGCEACQAFWRTLRELVTATRQLPAQGLSERAKRRLIDEAMTAPTSH